MIFSTPSQSLVYHSDADTTTLFENTDLLDNPPANAEEDDSIMEASSPLDMLQSTKTNQQTCESWEAARFQLHCSARHNLSYSAVDGISALTEELVEETTSRVRNKVAAVMDQHDVSSECRAAILEQFTTDISMFEGLLTQEAREKFYTANFNMVVCFMLTGYYMYYPS